MEGGGSPVEYSHRRSLNSKIDDCASLKRRKRLFFLFSLQLFGTFEKWLDLFLPRLLESQSATKIKPHSHTYTHTHKRHTLAHADTAHRKTTTGPHEYIRMDRKLNARPHECLPLTHTHSPREGGRGSANPSIGFIYSQREKEKTN